MRSKFKELLFIYFWPIWLWAVLFVILSIIATLYLYLLQRSRRVLYESALARLKAEQTRELERRNLWMQAVSAELNAQLRLMVGPLEDLIGKSAAHAKTDLEVIYRNSKILKSLVDQLALFTGPELAENELEFDWIDFSALVNETYLAFAQPASVKNIFYSFHKVAQVHVRGNREKMELVVSYLIGHALKETPDAGIVLLSMEELHDTVCLSVSDSGSNISDDEKNKIFGKAEAFSERPALRERLGNELYLIKMLVQHQGGSIDLKDNPIGGCIFSISFPKKSLAVEERLIPINDTTADESDLTPNVTEISNDELPYLDLMISDKPTILLIDDNYDIRYYLRNLFRQDFIVYEATSGESGLDLTRRIFPDVIISDVLMDGMDGITLCKLIKEDPSLSHIPVLLLTGDPDPLKELVGLEVGAVDFIKKPFDKAKLNARIKGILKSRSDLQNYFFNEVTLKNNFIRVSEDDKAFLYKCAAIFENHISDPDFEIQSMADELSMSYASFFKKIKAITGKTVKAFVRYLRLRKAAEFMINSNCNVNEAAISTGFNDMKHFREQFFSQFGLNPSEFIRRHRTAFHKAYRNQHGLNNSISL